MVKAAAKAASAKPAAKGRAGRVGPGRTIDQAWLRSQALKQLREQFKDLSEREQYHVLDAKIQN
eukprot:8077575-Lingulodinium_polyedra.AAC.1